MSVANAPGGVPILGIDLGTSNAAVAVADEHGLVQVLGDRDGRKIQPSVVSFHPNGTVIVGVEAKKRRVIDGPNTVYSAKRLIGQNFDHNEVAVTARRVPYKIREGANKQPLIVTRAGEFAVPEISAIVLDHMRKLAEDALGAPVSQAVITVPANFTDAQRAATATAGAIAGLSVAHVLNEPTAAALAYGHVRGLDETIAVYDFGGGTFDVSIVKLEKDVYRVLGTAGNSFLGGDDIDDRVAMTMVEFFLREERIDLRGHLAPMQRLRAAAEELKIDLSDDEWAQVQVDEIAHGAGGKALDLTFEMSRAELEDHARDIVSQTFPVCEEALRLAGLKIADIREVVLVGGTTKMPYVRRRVAEFFRRAPRTDVNPDEAVAMGAALQGLALGRMLETTQTGAPPSRAGTLPAATERTAQRGQHADVFPAATQASTGNAALARIKPKRVPASSIQQAGRQAGEAPEETFTGGSEAETYVPPEPSPSSPAIPRPGLPPTAKLALPAPRGTGEQSLDALFEDMDTTTAVAGTISGAKSLESDFEPTVERTRVPASPGAQPGSPDAAGSAAAEESMELDVTLLAPTRRLPAARSDDELPTSVKHKPGSASPGPNIGLAPLDLPPPRLKNRMPSEDAPTGRLPTQAPVVPAVVDVTPYSLGIGTVAGYCEELIRRNSRVPAQTVRVFSTSKDQQRTVRILICQGESRRIADNVVLGDLVLDGLAPRPRGQTRIEVTFEIDASGILHVRARDSATGVEQSASLNILGAPSAEEVQAAAARLRQIRQ